MPPIASIPNPIELVKDAPSIVNQQIELVKGLGKTATDKVLGLVSRYVILNEIKL